MLLDLLGEKPGRFPTRWSYFFARISSRPPYSLPERFTRRKAPCRMLRDLLSRVRGPRAHRRHPRSAGGVSETGEGQPRSRAKIPDEAYWGAQTSRAVENYPDLRRARAPRDDPSPTPASRRRARRRTSRWGGSPGRVVGAIVQACDEVLAGQHLEQFVVDVYQAGAGVSFHMNVNETIAGRASEILGSRAATGRRSIPTTTSTSASRRTTPSRRRSISRRSRSEGSCRRRSGGSPTRSRARRRSSADVVKSGRTHLMDAVPVTLGQEFRAYAAALSVTAGPSSTARSTADGARARRDGGGTGLNAPCRLPRKSDRAASRS